MDRDSGKPEAMDADAEVLLRMLELELTETRAKRRRDLARRRTSRVASLAGILIVITAAFFVLSILFSQLQEERPAHRQSTTSQNPRH